MKRSKIDIQSRADSSVWLKFERSNFWSHFRPIQVSRDIYCELIWIWKRVILYSFEYSTTLSFVSFLQNVPDIIFCQGHWSSNLNEKIYLKEKEIFDACPFNDNSEDNCVSLCHWSPVWGRKKQFAIENFSTLPFLRECLQMYRIVKI